VLISILKGIFRRKANKSLDVKTIPLSEYSSTETPIDQKIQSPPHLVVGSAHSVGVQRDHNEDTLFLCTALLADDKNVIPFGLFIVADGMGGHQHGELASSTAVRVFVNNIMVKLFPQVLGISEQGDDSIQEVIEEAIHQVQTEVTRKVPGGGTTLSAAMVIGDRVTTAHVGDSRIYFIYPDGRIQAVTHDHSLVRRLVELGQITDDEAALHPQRNVLYRAIGQSEPFKPDINTHLLPKPGWMLLCSDGLWGVVPEKDMFKIIRSNHDISEACNMLTRAANHAGGPDNISVILIKAG
jgi:PPM family protein phosphatase